MKNISFIFFFICIGCSPSINKYFKETRYVKDFKMNIINDSIQFSIKTPIDIEYVKDIKSLKKILKSQHTKIKDSVLIYGIAKDPEYEYFITISEKNNNTYPNSLIIFDTIINNKTYRFIGKPLNKNAIQSLNQDLEDIFKSLIVGKDYNKKIIGVMDIVEKHQNSNNYLAAINELNELPAYNEQEKWMKLQMLLTFSSFLANNDTYKNNLDILESGFIKNDTISEIIKRNLISKDNSIKKILEKAKSSKIIMINENHFYPNHRLFVVDLLENLKELGYNYLALEALDAEQDSILNLKKSYPTLKTGFYTSEQNFANLIRKAKKIGYKFVGYENFNNRKDRELAEAENLFNKTFKIDENAKVIVLAGIDHILERPTKTGKKWMATVFKELYGIDPLTISQTHLNNYRKLTNEEYCLLDSEIFANGKFSSVDFLLLNNIREKTDFDSIAYFYKNNVDMDLQLAIFYENELIGRYDYLKKIPYYTRILKKKERIEIPLSKAQNSTIIVFDQNQNLIEKKSISIDKIDALNFE